MLRGIKYKETSILKKIYRDFYLLQKNNINIVQQNFEKPGYDSIWNKKNLNKTKEYIWIIIILSKNPPEFFIKGSILQMYKIES